MNRYSHPDGVGNSLGNAHVGTESQETGEDEVVQQDGADQQHN
jgi:hypothetical protein